MARQARIFSSARSLLRLMVLGAIVVMAGSSSPASAQGTLAKITSDNAANLKMLGTLTGHTGNVLSLAFSPDGNTLASGSVDKTARLWNVRNPASAQPGAVLQGHQKQVAIVGFSADGKMVISGGYDYTLRFWDVQSGQQTAVQGDQDKPGPRIDALYNSFSPDMSLLLYSANGGVDLWDVKKGELVTPATLSVVSKTWGGAAFAGDGKSFYLADVASNNLYQIPAGEGEGKVALTGPDGTTYDGPLGVSPDGTLLAVSTSVDESIHLFNIKAGKPQVLSTGDQQDQYILQFSPDNSLLISSGGDASRVWDVKTGKQVFKFPDQQLMSVAFNAAGTLLAVSVPQNKNTDPVKIELWGVPGQ